MRLLPSVETQLVVDGMVECWVSRKCICEAIVFACDMVDCFWAVCLNDGEPSGQSGALGIAVAECVGESTQVSGNEFELREERISGDKWCLLIEV